MNWPVQPMKIVFIERSAPRFEPFPNGNGTHARMMADLLIAKLGGKAFSWGSGSIQDTGTLRTAYVGALKAADNHDFGPLLVFARS